MEPLLDIRGPAGLASRFRHRGCCLVPYFTQQVLWPLEDKNKASGGIFETTDECWCLKVWCFQLSLRKNQSDGTVCLNVVLAATADFSIHTCDLWGRVCISGWCWSGVTEPHQWDHWELKRAGVDLDKQLWWQKRIGQNEWEINKRFVTAVVSYAFRVTERSGHSTTGLRSTSVQFVPQDGANVQFI